MEFEKLAEELKSNTHLLYKRDRSQINGPNFFIKTHNY